MNKLLLIDGHNLLFKAFYGIPERISKTGKPIHGVIGFLGILKKIISFTTPTHLLIVFDSEGGLTRKNDLPTYKANRKDFSNLSDRENPFSQLKNIQSSLDFLSLQFIEPNDCEADDMIASYAEKYQFPIVIASSDSDFFQLINNKITVFRYHGKKSVFFNESMIIEKYGVTPSQFLDYKALIGDVADNIKGLRGIGPKTAINIIYGKRLLNLDEQKQFENNKSLISLNRSLTLKKKIDDLLIIYTINNIKISDLLVKMQIL